MKYKILILFVAFVLMLTFLLSCGDNDEKDSSGTTEADNVSDTQSDSAPTQDIEPIEETTVDTGPKIIKDYVQLYENPDHEPVSADGVGISIAMYFTTDMTLYSISFECPSWSDDIGQMTLDIYRWDTDYEMTIEGTPLVTETELFTDYVDNDTIEVELPEGEFVPGEYLYTFRDGRDGVGMWKSIESVEGIQCYYKGNMVSGVYKTHLYGWYYKE